MKSQIQTKAVRDSRKSTIRCSIFSNHTLNNSYDIQKLLNRNKFNIHSSQVTNTAEYKLPEQNS